ncbi:MAG: hypothetical protein K2X98_04790 [Alphaproteobacteria bacterium]|nr:hypothetical protein [Alphaproteobacteria bacterium]
MNLLKLTLLLGLSVCAVQPSMAMDDSDEFLGNQQATETFLATLKNLVQYGDTTRDNYDILALLTAEEMSNRIRHLFDPKRGPTEEELEWILRGMYKVMRDFKGNFLFENYFLNYPHFVEQDPKFKEHCRLLYAIALYFSDGYIRDNIAGRGSYLSTAEHLSRNYPEIGCFD